MDAAAVGAGLGVLGGGPRGFAGVGQEIGRPDLSG